MMNLSDADTGMKFVNLHIRGPYALKAIIP